MRVPFGERDRQAAHVVAGIRLRHHDTVGSRRHHGRDIRLPIVTVERIDAHVEQRPALGLAGLGDERGGERARGRPVRGRDGILQIEDQRISAARQTLGELPLAVAWNEEQ
jgi:hypothetical protein